MANNQANRDRRKALAAIAKETKALTPMIAAELSLLEPTVAQRFDLDTLPALDPAKCPRFTASDDQTINCGIPIRVVNDDSFEAAIAMPSAVLSSPSSVDKTTRNIETERLDILKRSSLSPFNLHPETAARVAVLNMASEISPGGGWMGGSSAQEEALCYRSTLAASLDRKWYPVQSRAGLYTRDVVVFRTAMGSGHSLMVPATDVEKLPVVSVLSVAGIRRPHVKKVGGDTQEDGAGSNNKPKKQTDKTGKLVYADTAARTLTKDKMRLCLRMAATEGHTMLVLGALGCGAFKNPPEEVAACWWEVLSEPEFAGGWFKEIQFAVFDRRNEGNLEIFRRFLDGNLIGADNLTSSGV